LFVRGFDADEFITFDVRFLADTIEVFVETVEEEG
jgi:hypothetical protein